MKKNILKRLTICALSALIVCTSAATTVSADTLSGYKTYKGSKLTSYMKNYTYSWITLTKLKWSGTTGGAYAGSVKADKIKHYDQFSLSGIGSISVSDSSAEATIDGSDVTYTYSTSNSKKITNVVSYKLSKGLTFTVSWDCATKYTFGSTNYRVTTGDAG